MAAKDPSCAGAFNRATPNKMYPAWKQHFSTCTCLNCTKNKKKK